MNQRQTDCIQALGRGLDILAEAPIKEAPCHLGQMKMAAERLKAGEKIHESLIVAAASVAGLVVHSATLGSMLSRPESVAYWDQVADSFGEAANAVQSCGRFLDDREDLDAGRDVGSFDHRAAALRNRVMLAHAIAFEPKLPSTPITAEDFK